MLKDFLTLLINCEENSVLIIWANSISLLLLDFLSLMVIPTLSTPMTSDAVQEIMFQYLEELIRDGRISTELRDLFLIHIQQTGAIEKLMDLLDAYGLLGQKPSYNQVVYFFVRSYIVDLVNDVESFSHFGYNFLGLESTSMMDFLKNGPTGTGVYRAVPVAVETASSVSDTASIVSDTASSGSDTASSRSDSSSTTSSESGAANGGFLDEIKESVKRFDARKPWLKWVALIATPIVLVGVAASLILG